MTYALGRTTSAEEGCMTEAIGTTYVTADASLSDLLWAIVQSDTFLTERMPEP